MKGLGQGVIKRFSGLLIKEVDKRLETPIIGFSFGDFDRHGKLAAWNICKALELNRLMYRVFPINRSTNYLLVNSGERWSISKRLYERVALNYPMIYTIHGQTRQDKSFMENFNLADKSAGITLVSSERQLVFIDKKTRKAVSMPESSDAFALPKDAKRFHIALAERPMSAFKTSRVAQFSDYDKSNHVNATSYVRWMIDAAAEAATKGALSSFRKNLDHCAEMVEMLYRKECFAGDNVDIYLWEEAQLCLCFNIEKQGQDGLATFGRINFYQDTFKSHI